MYIQLMVDLDIMENETKYEKVVVIEAKSKNTDVLIERIAKLYDLDASKLEVVHVDSINELPSPMAENVLPVIITDKASEAKVFKAPPVPDVHFESGNIYTGGGPMYDSKRSHKKTNKRR